MAAHAHPTDGSRGCRWSLPSRGCSAGEHLDGGDDWLSIEGGHGVERATGPRRGSVSNWGGPRETPLRESVLKDPHGARTEAVQREQFGLVVLHDLSQCGHADGRQCPSRRRSDLGEISGVMRATWRRRVACSHPRSTTPRPAGQRGRRSRARGAETAARHCPASRGKPRLPASAGGGGWGRTSLARSRTVAARVRW